MITIHRNTAVPTMDQSAFVMPDGFGSEVKVKGDLLREVRICHRNLQITVKWSNHGGTAQGNTRDTKFP